MPCRANYSTDDDFNRRTNELEGFLPHFIKNYCQLPKSASPNWIIDIGTAGGQIPIFLYQNIPKSNYQIIGIELSTCDDLIQAFERRMEENEISYSIEDNLINEIKDKVFLCQISSQEFHWNRLSGNIVGIFCLEALQTAIEGMLNNITRFIDKMTEESFIMVSYRQSSFQNSIDFSSFRDNINRQLSPHMTLLNKLPDHYQSEFNSSLSQGGIWIKSQH